MKTVINNIMAVQMFILRILDLLGSFDANLVCITTADNAVCRRLSYKGLALGARCLRRQTTAYQVRRSLVTYSASAINSNMLYHNTVG